MPLRELFAHFSERLLADYERTKSINHLGGRGSSREELFREFLAGHLPRKYAVGAGEIVSSQNQHSRQCDLVIYDDISFPRLFASGVHSIFPLESVYGVVEVKSDLTSERLAEAYDVIASVKSLSRYPDAFTVDNGSASWFVKYPVPVGIVLAFSAGRSLDAIVDQARALDETLTERYFRPDFIAVLGEGIIGPARPMRGARNEISIEVFHDTWTISRTLQHTLLRAYMQMTGDLGAVELKKLDLWDVVVQRERDS